MTRTTAKKLTWALYLGTRMVIEGQAERRGACTRLAIEAAYADAEQQNPEFARLHGIESITGYRLSIWGLRGGNIEYMRPL